MGSGYHSRSPEELRQYLDSLNLKSKTKTSHAIHHSCQYILGILFVLFVSIPGTKLGKLKL
jgi:hypothetical protein